ncbi:MAG: PRC-barrel domain-containing protein [Reyranella sp.]
MLTRIILATLITAGATAAYAQAPTAPQNTTTPPAATSPAAKPMPSRASADTRKLIGRNIQNAQNETIGEIKSVFIGKDGNVDSVMVGVGGFLGLGEREVRLNWSELNISQNGEKVTVNLTKDQLKAKPEYKYSDTAYRGQVFNETGIWKDDGVRADATTRSTSTSQTAANMPARSGGDFNAEGNLSGNALLGANVKNQANETVGEIEEVFVGTDGAIKTVVVSVGGFLGVGSKNVAVKWSDIKVERDGKDLRVKTTWTKDSLKAMPEYKEDQAAAPGTKSGG